MSESGGFKKRYIVVGVLFTIWVVAYLDRMVMATAIPYIADEFGLTPVSMGVVMSAFFIGYAFCQIPGGLLADKFGAQKVMFTGIAWWSVFTAITGMAYSLISMIFIRIAFGIGEGVFPAASWRAVANWFPAKERGAATGIMLSSNSFGPALAPLFVVAVMAAWGWRMVFYSLLALGVVMCFLIWHFIPDNPADSKFLSKEELAEIQAGDTSVSTAATGDEKKASFWSVIKVSAVWQSFLIFFFFDITLWGFLSWLPSYLVRARGFEMSTMGIVASLPFFVGTIGIILGGMISDKYFRYSRKKPLIVAQILGAIFLYQTYTVASANMTIVYETFAGFFLWYAFGSLFALPMSAISKNITGRAMGFINTAGQIAGFLSPIIIGYLIQISGGSFDSCFMCLIGATIVSCLFAFTVKERKEEAEA